MKRLLTFFRSLVSNRRARAKATVLVVLFTLMPSLVRAECVSLSKATAKATCVVMRVEGQQGVWFVLPVADELRKLKLEVPELHLQITKLEVALHSEKLSADAFLAAAETRRIALMASEASLDKALALSAKVEKDASAWYRSPWLWFSAGALLSGAAVIGVVTAVK